MVHNYNIQLSRTDRTFELIYTSKQVMFVFFLFQTWLPLILSHTPAGTSLKTILHFAQGIESKRFLHYDYGAERNTVIYNSEEPPEYDFSKIEVPIALFWGENDFLAQPKVQTL